MSLHPRAHSMPLICAVWALIIPEKLCFMKAVHPWADGLNCKFSSRSKWASLRVSSWASSRVCIQDLMSSIESVHPWADELHCETQAGHFSRDHVTQWFWLKRFIGRHLFSPVGLSSRWLAVPAPRALMRRARGLDYISPPSQSDILEIQMKLLIYLVFLLNSISFLNGISIKI